MRSVRELCVGVAGPLSGPLQRYGELLHMVEPELRKAHVAARVIVLDDRACANQALIVATELIEQCCRAVIGHFNSSCALAAAPLYAQAQIPFLAPCSTHPELLMVGGGFALRYCADDAAQVACALRFIEQRGHRVSEVAVIHDDTAYGRSLSSAWRRAANGCNVFGQHQDELAPAAAYVFFGKLHHALSFRARQLRAYPEALFVASDDAHIQEYLELGKAAVEGSYVIGHAEGHAGAVRCAAQHLAAVLAREPELAHAPLRARLHADSPTLRFDARGQRIDVDWTVFGVRNGRFEGTRAP